MYQSLIWAVILGNDASCLASALDAKDMESAPNALIDRVRRNIELARDFLRGQMLVDEEQAIELASAEPRDPHS